MNDVRSHASEIPGSRYTRPLLGPAGRTPPFRCSCCVTRQLFTSHHDPIRVMTLTGSPRRSQPEEHVTFTFRRCRHDFHLQ